MRILSSAVLVCVALVPDRPSPDANKPRDLDKLQGTWQVVAFETPNSKMTAEGLRNYPKLVIKGNEYTWAGGAAGTFEIDSVSNPKGIDYMGGRDTVNKAIFEFIDADTFRDCIGAAGAPRPTSFGTPPGEFLLVYKRVR